MYIRLLYDIMTMNLISKGEYIWQIIQFVVLIVKNVRLDIPVDVQVVKKLKAKFFGENVNCIYAIYKEIRNIAGNVLSFLAIC